MWAATYRLPQYPGENKTPCQWHGEKVYSAGKSSAKLAGRIPDRVSLSIKEVSIMCSGCGYLIAGKALRLSLNSPF